MSQRDEFDVANDGARVNLRDLIGKTVLFSPSEYVPVEKNAEGVIIGGGVMTTDYGRKDVVITDLVVLDAAGEPKEFFDVMIFNGMAIAALKRRIGRKFLGLVQYGAEKVKGNYPIILANPGAEGKQMGHDYLAGRTIKAALPDSETEDPFAVN